MQRNEQRNIERYKLDRQPDGHVVLRIGAARYPISEIKDVSSSGISFFMTQSAAESSQVAIEYTDPKVKIEVYGRLAWCTEQAQDQQTLASHRFVVGVQLLSPLMLLAVLNKH